MSKQKITEIKDPQGGRNLIREGDAIKVAAGIGNKTSFIGTFLGATVGPDGSIDCIDVVGKCGFRSIRPSRVHRVAQTKHGEKRQVVR